MSDSEQKIKCPKCGKSISIDDVLAHQIGEKIRKEIEIEQKVKEAKIAKKQKELEAQIIQLEDARKNTQIEVNKKVAEKLAIEKTTL